MAFLGLAPAAAAAAAPAAAGTAAVAGGTAAAASALTAAEVLQGVSAIGSLASGAATLAAGNGKSGQVLKPHDGPAVPLPPQGFALQAPQLLQAPRHQDLLSILNQYRS